MDQKFLFSISNRDEQKIGPQFSKIVVKAGVGVAKLKKIVVDVEVGVTISKKNWAMVGVGEVFGYKIVVLLWLWVV